MYCCHCGKENHDEAEICVYCGQAVDKRSSVIELKKKKMYCGHCGKAVDEDASFCSSCGCALNGIEKYDCNDIDDGDKSVLGFILSLFLGVIGLIIGIALYAPNTNARKTFVSAWIITFVATIAIALLVLIAVYASW